MMKYAVALLVLLAIGGLAGAQNEAPGVCVNCYANIITQEDHQDIDTVAIGPSVTDPQGETVAIGNEGLTAGVIVAPTATEFPSGEEAGKLFLAKAGFARIDQYMNQKVSNLGSVNPAEGSGAKGITWNKAIQAGWAVNQGLKEWDTETSPTYKKEGAYIGQGTVQLIDKIWDYDTREGPKVLNVDNKLAMITDDVKAIVDISTKASSQTSDSQSSSGAISNNVDITIAGKDP